MVSQTQSWSVSRTLTKSRSVLASGVMAVSLLGPSSIMAEDAMIVDMEAPPRPVVGRVVGTSSRSDEDDARLVRQLAKQRESGSATDGSYKSSLEKEQSKQKALKKSKEERRRDLCEKLGRGC